jgi:glycine amidinotransferase
LLPLKEGVFLANETFLGTNYIRNHLPTKFKNWKILYAQDTYISDRKYWDDISKNPISLASSRGMDINVLSLDRERILINDDAYKTADLLDKNGFIPVPIKFRHGEIFAGGIHCSTLDLERE